MRHYKTEVMAHIENGIDEISRIFGTDFKPKCINQIGVMTTRFVKRGNEFKMVSIKGDCEGVTGYSSDEFIGQDMLKVLKLNPAQIQAMYERLEQTGVVTKITKFTKKNGFIYEVLSIMTKVAEDTYEEVTVPFGNVVRL